MADESRIGRRGFIAGGLAGGLLTGKAAGAEPVPTWTRELGPGVDAAPYGQPSPHEAHVIRRHIPWMTSTRESSVNFAPLQDLHGIVTPNGLCFERHHAGVAQIAPQDHKLLIHGMVDRALAFTLDDILRLPSVSRFYFLECAANGVLERRRPQLDGVQFTHGMISCCQWTGVPLRALLDRCGVKPGAKWLLTEGADAAAMTRSLPLGKALDDVLLVYAQNGEKLRPEQGYPLRLIVPGWEGVASVKWLRRIELGDRPWHTREETARYTDLMPDGNARRFSWIMETKSVITGPCPEKPLKHKGPTAITGLAWSGRGRVARVDISVNGGRDWRPARLEEPILPKCLTRFHADWDWAGEPALLQSRAIDETGSIQPKMAELRAAQGDTGLYHNNAVQTWRVEADGRVRNVQVS